MSDPKDPTLFVFDGKLPPEPLATLTRGEDIGNLHHHHTFTFTFTPTGGPEKSVTLSGDDVKIVGMELDEAARSFWEALPQWNPLNPKVEELRGVIKVLTEHTKDWECAWDWNDDERVPLGIDHPIDCLEFFAKYNTENEPIEVFLRHCTSCKFRYWAKRASVL